MTRTTPNSSSLCRASVQVIGPPLTAAGLCALLNTLPEVTTAAVTDNTNINSADSSTKRGKVRSTFCNGLPLTLHIGNSEASQPLPFAMPSGDWILIYPSNAFGEGRLSGDSAAGQPVQRHWNGEHAVIGLHDNVDSLRSALRAVAAGASYFSTTSSQMLPVLSARQREVALLAASGLSNAEIAQHLFVDITTVKTHLTEVYKKTGIRRRSQIAGQIGV